jgi:hypothetical protein
MQDHNHTFYKVWPSAETVADNFLFDDDESEVILANLKVLFPDDKLSRLIYLNEIKHLLEVGAPELSVWIKLYQIAHSRRNPAGIEWMREKNG